MARTRLLIVAAVALVTGAAAGRLTAPSPHPDTEPDRPAGTTVDVEAPAADGWAGLVGRVVELNDANQAWVYSTDADVAAEVAAMTAPGARDGIVTDVTAQLGGLRDRLDRRAPVWWVSRTLAVRVTDADFEAGTATAEAWAVHVLSQRGTVDPTVTWTLTALDLVRVDGVWLLAAVSDGPGPAPAPGPGAWHVDAVTLDARLDGFALIGADGGPQFPPPPSPGDGREGGR